MGNSERLLKTTTIYVIGNLGSKIISFLIVPLYTFYISPDAMGTYDLLTTTITFLTPIIIMQMTDGLIRWMLDKEQNQLAVIHCGLYILLRNILLSLPILITIVVIFNVPYKSFFAVSLYCGAIYAVLIQIVRGLGDNKLYAMLGVINSFLIVSLNYFFIVFLHIGVKSFFIAGVISFIIPITIIIFKKKEIFKSFTISYDKKLLTDITKYSIMLLPNALNWQIINISDRYIVLAFLGTVWNGIYSISYKFPSLISTLTSLFNMAWQEDAISGFQQKGCNYLDSTQKKYYSNVFCHYYRLLFSSSILAISVTKLFVLNFMSIQYSDSWKYTGLLYLGTVFSALSSFYGISYQLYRKTKGAMITTTAGSIVNLLVNLVFVKFIGLHAASVSTFLAFLFMFVLRVYDTRTYFRLNVNWKEFLGLMLISIIAMFLPFFIEDIKTYCVIFLISSLLFIQLNGLYIKKLLTIYKKWFTRK